MSVFSKIIVADRKAKNDIKKNNDLNQKVLAVFDLLSKASDGQLRRQLVDQGHALILPHIKKGGHNIGWLATQLVEINIRSPLLKNCRELETALKRTFGGVSEEHLGDIVFGRGERLRSLYQRFEFLVDKTTKKMERRREESFDSNNGIKKSTTRPAINTKDRRRPAAHMHAPATAKSLTDGLVKLGLVKTETDEVEVEQLEEMAKAA